MRVAEKRGSKLGLQTSVYECSCKRAATSIAIFVVWVLLPAAMSPASPIKQDAKTLPLPPSSSFDVVSIKPSKQVDGNAAIHYRPDGFDATNVSVLMLLQDAYGTRPELVEKLPGWAQSARFDIKAKVLPEDGRLRQLGTSERARMVEGMLRDRFQLTFHQEYQTLLVYSLVVGKKGSRLKTPSQSTTENAAEPAVRSGLISNPGYIQAFDMPLSALADALSEYLGREVVDRTGLTQQYDFSLRWLPRLGGGAVQSDQGSDAPDLVTAVKEQLGLELRHSKAPVATFVVDQIQRPSPD